MKTHKASTTIVIVGAILLILGVITAAVGLALGGATAIDFRSWRVSWGGCVNMSAIERESFDFTSQQSIQQLVLDISFGDVEIIVPDGRPPENDDDRDERYGICGVEVNNYPKDYLTVTEQNGTLRVVDSRKNNWEWGSWNDPSPQITIRLSSLELVSLVIQNGVGDVTITGGPQFTVWQEALFNVGAGQLTIKADMIFESVCAITVGAGDAVIESAAVRDLKLDIGAGAMTFVGSVLRSADINVGAGDLNMALGGPVSDYYITGSVGVGEVNIFDNFIRGTGQSLYGYSSAPVKISLDCGFGSIRIIQA